MVRNQHAQRVKAIEHGKAAHRHSVYLFYSGRHDGLSSAPEVFHVVCDSGKGDHFITVA
jgi:hypothetical protein